MEKFYIEKPDKFELEDMTRNAREHLDEMLYTTGERFFDEEFIEEIKKKIGLTPSKSSIEPTRKIEEPVKTKKIGKKTKKDTK